MGISDLKKKLENKVLILGCSVNPQEQKPYGIRVDPHLDKNHNFKTSIELAQYIYANFDNFEIREITHFSETALNNLKKILDSHKTNYKIRARDY